MTKKELISSVAISVLIGGFVAFPVFAEGPVNISIVEKVDNGDRTYKDWEDITGAMPGEVYSAIPQVKNDGSEEVSVRMCLSESATNAGGETVALPANTFGISIDGHWELDDGGTGDVADPAFGNCYKYSEMLGVGDLTEPIFYEVILSPALGNEYQGATFNLHLYAEAIGGTPDPTPTPTPENPDTGTMTNSEPLTKPAAILLTLGAVTLIGMTIYWLRSSLRRKR